MVEKLWAYFPQENPQFHDEDKDGFIIVDDAVSDELL